MNIKTLFQPIPETQCVGTLVCDMQVETRADSLDVIDEEDDEERASDDEDSDRTMNDLIVYTRYRVYTVLSY